MGRYISAAKDKVTIEVDYPRPLFIFPDISGEQGNPYHFFKLVEEKLRHLGFYREAKELKGLGRRPYEEHFNNIHRFLDFTNSQQEKEDDEYIYLKIKKGVNDPEQPRIFSQSSKSQIQDLIDQGHDFSITNCYGRNHMNYLEDLDAVKILLEANKEHKWFDIFHIDNFNSTFLQGSKSLPVFSYLLSEMHDENPEIAKMFLYGTNVFNDNAFGEFLQECDQIFSPRSGLPTENQIAEIGQVLKILSLIDTDKCHEFIARLDVVEKTNKNFKNSDIKSSIYKTFLESTLNATETPSTKRVKI